MRSAFVQIIAALTTGVAAFSLAPEVMAQSAPPAAASEIPHEIDALLDDAPKANASQMDWQVFPRRQLVHFPTKALSEGISGATVIACMATADGIIRHCKVIEETPADCGFGTVALHYISSGRLKPSKNSDAITAFKIRVPFILG